MLLEPLFECRRTQAALLDEPMIPQDISDAADNSLDAAAAKAVKLVASASLGFSPDAIALETG